MSKFWLSILLVVVIMAVFTVALGIGDKYSFANSLTAIYRPLELLGELGEKIVKILGFWF